MKTILVLASYFKGERFMRQAKARGATVVLLTLQKLEHAAWPRECIDEVVLQNDKPTLEMTVRTVAYLFRKYRFDAIVPMDDFDVETAAALREHCRVPGIGETVGRYWRDKLAMRIRAREAGLPIPDFSRVLNHAELAEFFDRTPPPWMHKPRFQAGAAGIAKVESNEGAWQRVHSQGDDQSFALFEEYLPGDVYHVDSLVSDGKVVFAEAHRCGNPPFDVAHGGGIFTSETLEHGSDDERTLLALNETMLRAFELGHGVSHVEYIKAKKDGKFYFLECGARVGGAHIAELIEAASGLNPWAEWADLVIDGKGYEVPPRRHDYAGLLITLAKSERPDLSAYECPELFYRAPEKNHAGLVLKSADKSRIHSLVNDYRGRFLRDFNLVLPAASTPTN